MYSIPNVIESAETGSRPVGTNLKLFDVLRVSAAQPLSKRELVDTGTDKRYVRRDEDGKFKESVDVGRSLSADKRHQTKSDAKPVDGDKGDHKSK